MVIPILAYYIFFYNFALQDHSEAITSLQCSNEQVTVCSYVTLPFAHIIQLICKLNHQMLIAIQDTDYH